MNNNAKETAGFASSNLDLMNGFIGEEAAAHVYYCTNKLVNVCFIGAPGQHNWVLVDTGLPNFAAEIKRTAYKRFGTGTKPRAVILTHWHALGLRELLKVWDVPVYVHPAELPYLDGRKGLSYPKQAAGQGIMEKIIQLHVHMEKAADNKILTLPADGTVPALTGWRWLHTPGHTPGHISLYRETDDFLLAGDALATVKTDTLHDLLLQKTEIQGPSCYLTLDWLAAWESVKRLQELNPRTILAGHGRHMQGEALTKGLADLADNFIQMAVPD